MRVHALLSWFDEQPDWLTDVVLALEGIADTLTAVDGPYAMFPDSRESSGPEQAEAIRTAADEIGAECFIHPGRVWHGGEVEKRTTMFELAESHIDPFADWYFVIDADEVVIHHHGVRAALEATDLDVGTCSLLGVDQGNIQRVWAEGLEDFPTIVDSRLVCQIRNVYRAIPGLRCGHNHCTYLTPDDRVLWGVGEEMAVELNCRIDHRTDRRPAERMERSHTYYRLRDQSGIERAAA